MTHVLTVRDHRRPRPFYADLPRRAGGHRGESLHRQARQQLGVHQPGRTTHASGPDVERVPYAASSRVSSFMNLRVADLGGSRDRRAPGAHVLTAPRDRSPEDRCSMRDPDGYLIEAGPPVGLVQSRRAEQAPAGREAGRADGR
jgi:hypothetical protein